jgi:hypothetical protein
MTSVGKPLKRSDTEKPWAQKTRSRRIGNTPQRRYFLIVCEGEKTEPKYFKGLRDDLPKETVHVEIHGEGMNTLSLVERAGAIRDEMKRRGRPVDKVWVVFDRDSFAPDDFDNAISRAESLGYGAAWSNEAFELWYLLHFEFRSTAMRRTEFKGRLTTLLGFEYEKNAPGMYAELKGRTDQACAHAARLVEQARGISPHDANPCTHVHELVAELRALISSPCPE